MGLFPYSPKISAENITSSLPPFHINNLDELLNKLGNASMPHPTPVPIVTVPIEDDNMLLGYGKACTRISQSKYMHQLSEEYRNMQLQFSEVLHYLSYLLKIEVDMEMASYLHDAFYSIEYHGYSIPSYPKELQPKFDELKQYSSLYFLQKEELSLITSEFYLEMMKFFENVINGNTTVR